MTDFFEMEPMKYWNPPASMSAETKRMNIDRLIKNGSMLYAEKIDGNWSRCVITPERNALQTRGISKKTGTYGEIQDKVFFWDNVIKAFEGKGTTVLLGEVFYEGGIDKNVGSILRSLPEKSKSIQDEDYYKETSKTYKFSAKDRRDIEGNDFRNKKLKWYIFDVLAYEGKELMDTPFEERITYIDKAVAAIDNSLVIGAKYFPADKAMWDKLADIFSKGGEGIVMSKKSMLYQPSKRESWTTLKVKKEMELEADLFITATCPAEEDYKGKEIFTWQYWQDLRTGEKLEGQYYTEYHTSERPMRPITKNYFNNWPSAIECSAWDKNHKPVVVCKCAGLDEEFKSELRDNFDKYYMMPIKVSGMMISSSKEGEDISIRHPRLVSLRDGDIGVDDCLLSKII